MRGIPFLGDRTPKGFKTLSTLGLPIAGYASHPYKELFVDTSGYGSENEPALSQKRFIKAVGQLVESHGAIALSLSEIGQFQGHVRCMVAR